MYVTYTQYECPCVAQALRVLPLHATKFTLSIMSFQLDSQVVVSKHLVVSFLLAAHRGKAQALLDMKGYEARSTGVQFCCQFWIDMFWIAKN